MGVTILGNNTLYQNIRLVKEIYPWRPKGIIRLLRFTSKNVMHEGVNVLSGGLKSF